MIRLRNSSLEQNFFGLSFAEGMPDSLFLKRFYEDGGLLAGTWN